MIQRWRHLQRDEGGTSLTEFVICLPILLMIMSFVYHMGMAGHLLTQEAAKAQKDLWYEVVEHTHDRDSGQQLVNLESPNPHESHSDGARQDREFLQQERIGQRRESLADELRGHEVDAHQGLDSGASWGESMARTRAANNQIAFRGARESMTSDPGQVVGGSAYANALVDDRGGGLGLGGGSGALQPAAARVGGGSPAVAGAGQRYGVIHSLRESATDLPGGFTLPIRAQLDVLVPPKPVESSRDVAAITRMELEQSAPYRDLLGIQEDQSFGVEGPPSAPSWPPDP